MLVVLVLVLVGLLIIIIIIMIMIVSLLIITITKINQTFMISVRSGSLELSLCWTFQQGRWYISSSDTAGK